MDYKDTLLMPKTDFPMRGGLPNKEPQIQQKWKEQDLYQKILKKMKAIRHIFCMMVHRMQTEAFIWDTL